MVKNIVDMSIKEIYYNWKINLKNIIDDLTKFFYGLDKYNSNFNDIDDPNKWWIGIVNVLKDLYIILTKKERGIYVGILFIIISVMMFIIQITS